MRLQSVRPRVELVGARTVTATVERKRGRAGVEDRERIRRRDKGLCQACLREGRYTLGADVDHIIPLHKGGADTDENKELMCFDCHAEKTKKDMRL